MLAIHRARDHVLLAVVRDAEAAERFCAAVVIPTTVTPTTTAIIREQLRLARAAAARLRTILCNTEAA